jgi:predicted NACHT family NTPase
MSYLPFTANTQSDLNALPIIEGITQQQADDVNARLKDILTSVNSFENGRISAIQNKRNIKQKMNLYDVAKDHRNYQEKILTTGKIRPTMIDEMNYNYKQINEVDYQTYILGTITIMSLFILAISI